MPEFGRIVERILSFPSNFFQKICLRFQRRRINTELWIRVVILLFLDILMNGTFEALLIACLRPSFFGFMIHQHDSSSSSSNQNLTTNQQQQQFGPQYNFWEIFYAFDRRKVNELNLRAKIYLSTRELIGLELTCLFSLFYGLILLFSNASHVISILGWLGPFIILQCSIGFYDDVRFFGDDEENLEFSAKSLTFATFYALFLAIFGYLASNFYANSRNFDKKFAKFLPKLFLKLTFYTPLLKFCGLQKLIFDRFLPESSLKYAVLAANLIAELLHLYANSAKIARILCDATGRVTRTVRDFGMQMFLAQEWTRLQVPRLFRCLFTVRILIQTVLYCSAFGLSGGETIFKNDHVTSFDDSTTNQTTTVKGVGGAIINSEHFLGGVLQYLTVRSCETMTSIFASTGFVSAMGGGFGSFFDWLLAGGVGTATAAGGVANALLANRVEAGAEPGGGGGDEGDQNPAVLTGILFIILCIQTDITMLSAEKRLTKLYRNFWLLLMALLHYVHQAVNHVLSRLTAVGDFRLTRHVRPLLVASFVLTIPVVFLLLIWPTFGHNGMFNPWILSVAIFAMELLIKMLVTLTVYVISVLDVKLLKFHPKTETVVDWVQIVGSCLEYAFGIILFVDGLWIFWFDQGGLLRLLMIGCHGYYNIYQQGVDGWRAFKRRSACQAKLNALEEASEQRLRVHNDVCVICFQEMSPGSAKVTRCGHFFHTVCVRKLLFHRDTCPMCHRPLY